MRLSPRHLAAMAAAAALVLGAASPPAPDSVSFQLNSWGNLLSSWTVNADGSGEHVTLRHAEGAPFGTGDREVHKLAPDPTRYRRLLDALHPARAYAGRTVPCGPKAYDLPYGDIAWRHAGTDRSLHFDSGCSSSTARRVLASLHAADALVGKWSEGVPKAEQH